MCIYHGKKIVKFTFSFYFIRILYPLQYVIGI